MNRMRPPVSVDELFAHSICISRRCDHWRRSMLARCFAREHLPVPRFVNAIELPGIAKSPGWGEKCAHHAGCAASHAMCIHVAEMFDWPWVCIFEDDAVPKKGCRPMLESALRGVPDACGILFLGYTHLRGTHGRNGDIWCMPGIKFAGTHAYVIFRDCMAMWSRAYAPGESRLHIADQIYWEYKPLMERTMLLEDPLFMQANCIRGRWKYTRRSGHWSDAPDKGFPRIEEMMKLS